MDRLTEYDYIIQYRPGKATVMGLADGMSRMPGRYNQVAKAEDTERMAMATNVVRIALPTSLQPVRSHLPYTVLWALGKRAMILMRKKPLPRTPPALRIAGAKF